MAERIVHCAKLHQDLPGLEETPFDHPLGERIYNEVSQRAWDMWKEHLKMIINEFRLNPATMEAQEMILKQMEAYFFGDGGAAPPPDYVPPSGG
jgi:Fe-S cluster biosynthesis and repair protein YggX